jgi:hypothetical protein
MIGILGLALVALVPLRMSFVAVARARKGGVSGSVVWTSILLFGLCGLSYLVVGFGTGMTDDGSAGNPCGGMSRGATYLAFYWIPAVFFVGGLAPLVAAAAKAPWLSRSSKIAAAIWTGAFAVFAIERGFTSTPGTCGTPPGKTYVGVVNISIALTVAWFLGLAAVALFRERKWHRTHGRPRRAPSRGIPNDL